MGCELWVEKDKGPHRSRPLHLRSFEKYNSYPNRPTTHNPQPITNPPFLSSIISQRPIKIDPSLALLRSQRHRMSQSLLQRTLEEYKIRQTPHRSSYVLSAFILKELGITRWSRQRPPAQERVEEITAWIREHQDVVGTISLAWHPTERLVCYDGQHRLHALFQQVETQACASQTHTSPMDITALVDIMWDTTELAIMAAFQTINRAVPVSELYTDPQDTLHSIKGEISDYVASLATTYKPFLSTSAKPCRPNFNRDGLTESLFSLWRDDLQEAVPFQRIIGALTRLNKTYDEDEDSIPKERTLKKFPAIHRKCSAHKFWLFAETGRLCVDDLKRLL